MSNCNLEKFLFIVINMCRVLYKCARERKLPISRYSYGNGGLHLGDIGWLFL